MSKKRVAIIGAGSSGLTSIKQCLADDLEPVCFEATDDIGGLWNYTEVTEENKDPHSSICRSTIINTSKETMSYSDFPIPNDWPTYMHGKFVKKYFDLYADNFNLKQYIKFNTTVTRASILPDQRWSVSYINNEAGEQSEEFDFVLVCIGHHRYPRLPKFEGMDVFKGKQLHSHFYRSPEEFANKRVIVVGVGNSGMDISVELSHSASEVYLVSRRGTLPWILPRFVSGEPIDHLSSRFNMIVMPNFFRALLFKLIFHVSFGSYPDGLKPKTHPFSNHPTIKSDIFERLKTGTLFVKPNIVEIKDDNSVVFDDGSIVENVDAIVYCTGYYYRFPFLEKEILTGGKEIEEQFEEEFRTNLVWLYKYMFPPNVPNIAFIGLIQANGALFPIGELQARYITALINGNVPPLPSTEVMNKDVRRHLAKIKKVFYLSGRHTIECEALMYSDDIAKQLGCMPTHMKIIWKFGLKVWWKWVFGIPVPAQYRLLGRQSWDNAAKVILDLSK
ncbi:269_t:CDS:10 [Entrophospora sp. SA101]|nr:4538_t:CDS:10 [Entrophospora sp. SA101]CAJ0825219.1 269_t:CDS:10 [Entrophospora sp. SA101]